MEVSCLQKPLSRESEYDLLVSLLGDGFPVTPCVVISGPPGSGKSTLIHAVLRNRLKQSMFKSVEVSCLEACSGKNNGIINSTQNVVLFDLILYQIMFNYNLPFDNVRKCDNPATFIERVSELLIRISRKEAKRIITFAVVFHQAEKLRDGSDNLLPVVVNLNSLISSHLQTNLPGVTLPNVVSILITNCAWDKFYSGTFTADPTIIYLRSYTREQLAEILTYYAPERCTRYARFVDLILTICLPVTRNIGELLYLARFNWKTFDEPVSSGKVAADDEWAQWRNALPTLKRSLSTVYLRPEIGSFETHDTATGPINTHQLYSSSNLLELPLYSRFLLVAAYIASYNPKSADKRFLVKNTGKLSVRAKRQEKKTEHVNNHLLGPRLFQLDRLLAIFYALLDLEGENEQRPLYTCLLASQVACLSGLGLIASASSTNAAGTSIYNTVGLPGAYSNPEDPLANPRFRCLVNLETARSVAKSININITAHLLDFV